MSSIDFIDHSNYFRHSIYVGLNHVDAAGVIFFPKLYEMTQQTFEYFFLSNDDAEITNLSQFIHAQNIFPLVVHSESDYFLPIKHADRLNIVMSCQRLGRSSFTLFYQFFFNDNENDNENDNKKCNENDDNLAASATVIHTLVNVKTRRSEPMNDLWRKKLSAIFHPSPPK